MTEKEHWICGTEAVSLTDLLVIGVVGCITIIILAFLILIIYKVAKKILQQNNNKK